MSLSRNWDRAFGRQAPESVNIGCLNDNRGGSCIASTAHLPYAPSIFGIAALSLGICSFPSVHL
jgi:hypothetical protein